MVLRHGVGISWYFDEWRAADGCSADPLESTQWHRIFVAGSLAHDSHQYHRLRLSCQRVFGHAALGGTTTDASTSRQQRVVLFHFFRLAIRSGLHRGWTDFWSVVSGSGLVA